jgi:cyclopropane fatty-acyl-phospholipid synthase-like methyltransferase
VAQEHPLYSELQRLVRRSVASGAQHARKLAESLELEPKPWDLTFQKWIDEAKSLGRDPNDVADERWGNARAGAEKLYLPLFDRQSVVLELGPGTGRYTRYLLPECREMVLVDYSKYVCAWLEEYFAGKGNLRVVHAKDYAMGQVDDGSIDAVIANGVFEHIDLEGFFHYLSTFARVLRRGGRGAINFNNIMSPGGFEHFRNKLPSGMGERSIFRFYHPETVSKLCNEAGLAVERMDTTEHRFAFLVFVKPT